MQAARFVQNPPQHMSLPMPSRPEWRHCSVRCPRAGASQLPQHTALGDCTFAQISSPHNHAGVNARLNHKNWCDVHAHIPATNSHFIRTTHSCCGYNCRCQKSLTKRQQLNADATPPYVRLPRGMGSFCKLVQAGPLFASLWQRHVTPAWRRRAPLAFKCELCVASVARHFAFPYCQSHSDPFGEERACTAQRRASHRF